MAAGKYDIRIEQGATFQRRFTWKDPSGNLVNLTGYVAKLQVRLTPTSLTTLFDLSSTAGDIVLGGAAGTIDVTITDTETAALALGDQGISAVYDLQLIAPDGTVYRLVEGKAILTPRVTA